MSDGTVLFGTENQAHRWILIGQHPMFPSIVQIQIHLPGICVRELADFQINDNQTTEPAMKEEQVNPIPFSADAEPSLACNEREIVAELQKKFLELADEGTFEIRFRVFIFQVKEFQHKRIADLRVCGESARNGNRRGPLSTQTFICSTGDLSVQFSDRPPAA